MPARTPDQLEDTSILLFEEENADASILLLEGENADTALWRTAVGMLFQGDLSKAFEQMLNDLEENPDLTLNSWARGVILKKSSDRLQQAKDAGRKITPSFRLFSVLARVLSSPARTRRERSALIYAPRDLPPTSFSESGGGGPLR